MLVPGPKSALTVVHSYFLDEMPISAVSKENQGCQFAISNVYIAMMNLLQMSSGRTSDNANASSK